MNHKKNPASSPIKWRLLIFNILHCLIDFSLKVGFLKVDELAPN